QWHIAIDDRGCGAGMRSITTVHDAFFLVSVNCQLMTWKPVNAMSVHYPLECVPSSIIRSWASPVAGGAGATFQHHRIRCRKVRPDVFAPPCGRAQDGHF